ncbi:MAG: hypothetical protein QW815_07685, partial [Nitrososphaerota archaeon]
YTYLHNTLGDKFKVPDLLKRKVEANELGIKSGRGFYDYTHRQIESIIKRRDEWLIEQLKYRGLLKSRRQPQHAQNFT